MKLEEIKSYCIHLKFRKDREENMFKELSNFKPDTEIFDAIKSPIGHIGTSESFKAIIRKAQEQNLDQVLIFEDDVKFTSDKSAEQFQLCLDELPDNYDILLGGAYSIIDKTDLDGTGNIRKIGDFASLHCTLINKSAYTKLLNHNTNKIKHLDRYLGDLSINGELNVYLAYPMLAIQHMTYSDNIKENLDYSYMLKDFDILS